MLRRLGDHVGEGRYPNRLRDVRRRLGWKQERTIFELERMAVVTDTRIASRASLKTELSRWENGHTRVRPEYRALFRLIYKSSDNELGFRADLTDEIIMAALTPVSFREPWDTAFASAAEEW